MPNQFSEIHRLADEAIAKIVKERNIAIENLTEEQTCAVFKQAIQSGDIVRQVRIDNGGQTVIYVPFAERERMESEIQTLKSELLALANPDGRFTGKWPVILYFDTKADKDAFVADVEEIHPNLKSRKLDA